VLITRDYRLFDIQHTVLPTRLSLGEFYEELVSTQQILNSKHLGWSAVRDAASLAVGRLLHGQTNFVKMLWKFNGVYNPKLQIADHQRPVEYEIPLPPAPQKQVDPKLLYIHEALGRQSRAIDESTEAFVDQNRLSATP
jgi:hypothetical protein